MANIYTHVMDKQRGAAAKLLDHYLNRVVRSAQRQTICVVNGAANGAVRRNVSKY